MKTTVRKSRSRLLRKVLALLEKQFGRRRRRRRPDPLDTLLHAVLADTGNDTQSEQILERMRAYLVDWNELRVSTPRSIEELIHPLPNAAEKALLLKGILQLLFTERHQLNLNHFKRFGHKRIWEELDRFGPMSNAVKARLLLKAYDMNILPMTQDIERVSKRIALVENYLTTDKAQEALEEILPPKRIYSFFHLLSEHADAVCKTRSYDCTSCVLVKVCERGQAVTDKQGDNS